ncbi:MAG: glycerol-3-phosphate 1-O-acyltransferase PlsY [Clostridia bacterium]|nr:glycerol-3-phosphate 1-O-acyltransferase PlsY [Clostridia bacterium]
MSLFDFFSIGISGYLTSDKFGLSEGWTIAVMISAALICIVAPYLLGSMNFAIIISKKRYKADIRSFGSGNAGATNMMRTFGKAAAGLTFLGDALKAFVSGMIGYAAMGQYGVYIAGLFCILGHMFPVYYKFKGGKGVVTAAISILMCNPLVFLILFVIFVLIVLATRYISLASVMCMLLYPVVLDRIEKLLNGATGAYVIIALINAVLVIFMHRENIKRLIQGKENKFSFKKSVKAEDKKAENTADVKVNDKDE